MTRLNHLLHAGFGVRALCGMRREASICALRAPSSSAASRTRPICLPSYATGYAADSAPLRRDSRARRKCSRSGQVSRSPGKVNFLFVARILHASDLHFGRPAVAAQLVSLRNCITELAPDAVAISGDLTQRCANSEFVRARAYLDDIRKAAPVI